MNKSTHWIEESIGLSTRNLFSPYSLLSPFLKVCSRRKTPSRRYVDRQKWVCDPFYPLHRTQNRLMVPLINVMVRVMGVVRCEQTLNVLFFVIRIMERTWVCLSPILSIIHIVTTGTKLLLTVKGWRAF